MTRGILGLDLAESYGWAVVNSDGKYVDSGCRRLRAAGRGEKAHQLANSIADLITEFSPDFVAIEAPNSRHFGAARNLFGYAMVAHMIAHIRELGFVEITRSACYARVVGSGNAKKIAGVEFARKFKPLCNSDDESDAILVAFAAHQMRTETSVRSAALPDVPPVKKRTASRPRREPTNAAGLRVMARARAKGVLA